MQVMKKSHIFIIVVIAFVLGCGVLGLVTVTRVIDQIHIDQIQLQAVRTRVVASGKDFPILDDIDVIRNSMVTAYASDIGDTDPCYYGDVTLVIGSQLSEAQILDRYTSLLKPNGDYLRALDDTSTWSRIFYRGLNEYAVIEGIHDAFIGHNLGVDLVQAKKKYASVMYIRIVYALPEREGC